MSAFRTYKLTSSDKTHHAMAQYQYYVAAYELRLYSQKDQAGTNFALSGTAFATDYDPSFPAVNMNDNNVNSVWSSGTSEILRTIGVDSGYGVTNILRSFSILSAANIYGLFFPKSFIVSGSMGNKDSSIWVPIGTFTTTNTTTDKTLLTYNINFNYFQNPVIPNIIVY